MAQEAWELGALQEKLAIERAALDEDRLRLRLVGEQLTAREQVCVCRACVRACVRACAGAGQHEIPLLHVLLSVLEQGLAQWGDTNEYCSTS